jgi:predicted nucleic acid-binding protein
MAIASCLVDTNILLRLTRRSDPQHQAVSGAISRFAAQGTNLCFTHQNIAEFWNVMTRPFARNGFGLTISEAEKEIWTIETGMSLLPDSEIVYSEWRRIVVEHKVSGVQVHDARLAAVMIVHKVNHILTRNISDFDRYEGIPQFHPTAFDPMYPPALWYGCFGAVRGVIWLCCDNQTHSCFGVAEARGDFARRRV